MPSGARKSSVVALLPLNWFAAAVRLIMSTAAPNTLVVAGPNFRLSSQNATSTPRKGPENGTKPTLTASGIGKSSKQGCHRGRNDPNGVLSGFPLLRDSPGERFQARGHYGLYDAALP